MSNLHNNSIRVILTHQAPDGGYLASPTLPDYQYCWFRDGAFVAYAMDLVTEHESTRRFHDWCARVVNQRQAVVERAITKAKRSEPLTAADYLHTRYTLAGEEGGDETWPNFQLDGLGTWLWALAEHARMAGLGSLPCAWRDAARLAARYLAALWSYPCYDCWEEVQDRVHPYTLAAIYGGLQALSSLSVDGPRVETAAAIRAFVLEHGVSDGVLIKSVGNPDVDASLLGICTPYRLLGPHHPVVQATVSRIENELQRDGRGVHRYAADTYYGGGEWVLLTAWLGWHYAELGDIKRAREMLTWVEAQADDEGNLPEQLPRTLTDPRYLALWREQRGEIARPLLWSHAKYIILEQKLAPHQHAPPRRFRSTIFDNTSGLI